MNRRQKKPDSWSESGSSESLKVFQGNVLHHTRTEVGTHRHVTSRAAAAGGKNCHMAILAGLMEPATHKGSSFPRKRESMFMGKWIPTIAGKASFARVTNQDGATGLSLLRSVRTLMPSNTAARVRFPPLTSSARAINFASASPTSSDVNTSAPSGIAA